jgi:chitin disaccharide deacetylase
MKNTVCFLLTLLVAVTGARAQQTSLQERLGYPKDAKLVIIHADDLGVAHAENAASVYAMEKGSVSSASIMIPCPWMPEIAAYAAAHPKADLGLHITLTSEWEQYKWGPVTAKNLVPGLVNARGFFYPATDSVTLYGNAAEVETEIRNQVKRAIQFGIDPTHLDAHMGTAFSKADFFRAYLKVAAEYRIPAFIPAGLLQAHQLSADSLKAAGQVIVDEVLSAGPEHKQEGFKKFYTEAIKKIRPGLTYLIIHTAYDTDEMKAITINHPDWGSAWRQMDFDFFTSKDCEALLKQQNIYVISWREIRDKITRASK